MKEKAILVLSRKTEDEIVIGDNVIIKVLGIQGDKVKIGISAPRDVPIMRRELIDAHHWQDEGGGG